MQYLCRVLFPQEKYGAEIKLGVERANDRLDGAQIEWTQLELVTQSSNVGHRNDECWIFSFVFFCGGRNHEGSTNGTALGRTFSSEPHQLYHYSILSTDKHRI